MRVLLLAAVVACGEPKAADVVAKATSTTPVPAHGAGRDRWRGGGVYLDGVPIGALRFAELPDGLEPVWETQRRRLPFKQGETPRFEETRVARYRVTDYLRAIGIPLADITEVQLLGGRDSAIVVTREDLMKHADDVMFKFAGGNFGKAVPIVRDVQVGTSFDGMLAMTIYMKKKPPRLTADETLELDGVPQRGIPYYGQPLREGIRIYVDGRMVAVLKRNLIAGSSLPETRWQLRDVLAQQGVTTQGIARIELIHDEVRSAKLDFAGVDFAFNPGASGEISVGAQNLPANALALYTERQ
jgi:hypothetical protein